MEENPRCGPRFSFSLRTFFIVITLCVGIVALKTSSVARQRAVMREIERHGGSFQFDYVYDLDRKLDDPKTATQVFAALKASKISYPPPPAGPAWIRQIVGDDFFASIETVSFRGCDDDTLRSVAPHLANLPNLRGLYLSTSTQLTRDGLEQLKVLSRLKVLGLRETGIRVDDPAIVKLRRDIPGLQIAY